MRACLRLELRFSAAPPGGQGQWTDASEGERLPPEKRAHLSLMSVTGAIYLSFRASVRLGGTMKCAHQRGGVKKEEGRGWEEKQAMSERRLWQV